MTINRNLPYAVQHVQYYDPDMLDRRTLRNLSDECEDWLKYIQPILAVKEVAEIFKSDIDSVRNTLYIIGSALEKRKK